MAAWVLRCGDMYRPVVQKVGSRQAHLMRLVGFPTGGILCPVITAIWSGGISGSIRV